MDSVSALDIGQLEQSDRSVSVEHRLMRNPCARRVSLGRGGRWISEYVELEVWFRCHSRLGSPLLVRQSTSECSCESRFRLQARSIDVTRSSRILRGMRAGPGEGYCSWAFVGRIPIES